MRMDVEVKKKWLEALRSGDYKQTKETLKDDTGFCCLGVLCDLHAEAYGRGWENNAGRFSYDGSNGILPKVVTNWAGLDCNNPSIGKETGINPTLANLNDAGKDFNEIADVIEENL